MAKVTIEDFKLVQEKKLSLTEIANKSGMSKQAVSQMFKKYQDQDQENKQDLAKSLLGIFDSVFDELAVSDQLPESYAFEPVYTSSVGIRKSGWKVVGNRELTQENVNLSLRITGGQVWLGDNCLRVATAEDSRTIRQMIVFGYPYLMKKIKQWRKTVSSSITKSGLNEGENVPEN